MTEKNKVIESIEDKDKLLEVVKVLLNQIPNFEITEAADDFLKGIMLNPLGNQKVIFLSVPDYLSSSYQKYEELKKSIDLIFNKETPELIFLVSSKNITEGFKSRLIKESRIPIQFWPREILIEKLDSHYPDFWRHSDQELISYEKEFEASLHDEWTINKIKQFKSAHAKLMDIFIEPRLSHKVNDFESTKKAFKKVSIEELKKFNSPVILEGEPGIGKTRLLKQIGVEFIHSNTRDSNSKYLPIFINNINLIETRKGEKQLICIIDAIQNKLNTHLNGISLEIAIKNYNLVLLIDTIDDFSKENQEQLLNELKSFSEKGVKIFFGTRYQEYSSINGMTHLGKCEEIYVEKFTDHQIKTFISLYFKNDLRKAENLLESLKENSIIQRLPITPLNLSLISILYEENNFEIPATITDIYDNFSNLLLGRALPDSRFDFFDINIKERILSVYALELLQRGERNYMSVEEFISFFEDFFAPISGTIDLNLLPEALNYLVSNTGILVIQDSRYVRFLHESYMEYYASREIFTHKRTELEPKLIDNFLEVSWQYASIFYAGRSKQMDTFLTRVIERCSQANKAIEMFKSVHGLGYLSQALYMTDDTIRKKAILQALSNVIDVLDWMKKMGADDKFFFKNLSLPVVSVINAMIFFDNHNSITLKKPLELAFDELFPKLEISHGNVSKIDGNVGFKLFVIAMTLASQRLGNTKPMEKLIDDSPIMTDPLFESMLDFGVSMAGSKDLHQIKESFKRPLQKSSTKLGIADFNKKGQNLYLTAPLGRYRFSHHDSIYPDRKYLLITEGKTDVQIIEHAYVVLTDQIPYWAISPVQESGGGANTLGKCLESGSALIKENEKVIGIFDNDDSGIAQFNGGIKNFIPLNGSKRIKKHPTTELYALKLPIPPFRENYYNDQQKFNFFCIEHYFSDEFLRLHNMLKQSPIPGIFQINEKNKTEFSKAIRNISEREIFIEFIFLFKEIDAIFGVESPDYQAT